MSCLKTCYYSEEETATLKSEKVPHHVAMILDGNRRYAKRLGRPVFFGHQAGADIILDTVKAAKELGIKVLTLFIFSTENWNRPALEVAALMQLFESFILSNIPDMIAHRIRFKTIGQVERFPASLQAAIRKAKEETADCEGITALFAMNYGGRDELLRAFKLLLADYQQDRLNLNELTEKSISSYLDTAPHPDPDLLIRTGGENRVSNFLLWQLSYAELYVTESLWPEFTPAHLLNAVREYQSRERRIGS